MFALLIGTSLVAASFIQVNAFGLCPHTLEIDQAEELPGQLFDAIRRVALCKGRRARRRHPAVAATLSLLSRIPVYINPGSSGGRDCPRFQTRKIRGRPRLLSTPPTQSRTWYTAFSYGCINWIQNTQKHRYDGPIKITGVNHPQLRRVRTAGHPPVLCRRRS